MTQEQTLATEVTDTSTQGQDAERQARVYSQAEFDDAMAKMKNAVVRRALKPYEELGDIERLREIKAAHEQREQAEQVRRGEFERILQEKAEKWNSELRKRDQIIESYRVDAPLVAAAARKRSVNPEQVRDLLRSQVALNADGEVEVRDGQGKVRYTDSGTAWTVEHLVDEFLSANPHFVQATPSTSTSQSRIQDPRAVQMDMTKLDMKNPEHRAIYAKYRREAGIA